MSPRSVVRCFRNVIAYAVVAFLCAGCASYMTPGGPAPLAELAGANASDAAEQLSPQFPLNLVAVRLQAAVYRSLSTTGYGEGRFSGIAPPKLLKTDRTSTRLNSTP